MRWKALLAVLTILVIIGLLVLTPQGKNLLSKFGIDLSGFLALVKPPVASNYFPFSLTVNKTSISEMSFNLKDGNVRVNGTYVDDIIVGNSIREKKTKRGHVDLSGFEGTVYVANTIKILGETKSIVLEGEVTRAIDKTLRVQIEIYPVTYFVAPITENKIKLSSIDGKLERLGEGAIQPLRNDTIEINNFIGNLELEDNLILLTGSTTQITGKTFTWKS